jgi:ABC-type glycerol-3-phosphate transport system substrate-binding protein
VADGPAAALGSRRLWQRGRHHHATPITLYTCVNDTTIQPVIQKFEAAHAGAKVDLFRAPTGQLNARVASDVRSGGLKADVIWACDPLTMQDYVVRAWLGAGWGIGVPPGTEPQVLAPSGRREVVTATLTGTQSHSSPAARSSPSTSTR